MRKMYGTPYYLAPEVIKECYNEKCDVWSIGVIMYIMLNGKPHFNGENSKEIMNNIRKGNYLMDFESSEEVKILIRQLMCYDYLQRISV